MRPEKRASERLEAAVDSREPGPAWRVACEEGFDMSLVALSLSKTPWERLLEHDEALQFAALLRHVGGYLDGKSTLSAPRPGR